MGFQRVRGHGGIIPPNLIQKFFPCHRFVAGPKQILKDRSFFIGQAHFALVRFADQQFIGRLKCVRTNRKNRIVATFMSTL